MYFFPLVVHSFAKKVIEIERFDKPFYLYKSFYGVNLSPHLDLPSINILRDLGIGMLRIGGNEYDAYNWKNSFVYNPEYGYVKMQPIEDIIKILGKADIEPLLQINMLGNYPLKNKGKWNFKNKFDLKIITDLLIKFNSKNHTKIKNFSLGNEFEHWTETHKYFFINRVNSFSADEYIKRYTKIVLSMRKIQEKISGNANDIKFWGPEISSAFNGWQTQNVSEDCRWNTKGVKYICSYGKNKKFSYFIPYFLSVLKKSEGDIVLNPNEYKLIDFLSFHYYPIYREKISEPNSIIKKSSGAFPLTEVLVSSSYLDRSYLSNSFDLGMPKKNDDGILKKFKQWRNRFYPQLKIGLTEFGVDPDDRVFSYPIELRPLFFANLIGVSSINKLSFLNKFRLNSISPNVAPWSLLINGKKTDLYRVMKLFSHNYLGEILKIKNNVKDKVKIYMSERGTNLNLFMINISNARKKINIRIKLESNKHSGIITEAIGPYSIKYIKYDKNYKMLEFKLLAFKK